MASNLSKRLRELDRTKSAPPIPGQRDPGDERPVEAVVFAMSALIGLLAIVAAAVVFGIGTIESSLESTIKETLAAEGVTNVEVIATARDVLVVGEVAEEEQVAAAVEVVRTIPGVLKADTNVRVTVIQEVVDVGVDSDPLILVWDAAGATVTGTLSTREIVDAIVASLAAEFGTLDSSGVTVREGLDSERDWTSAYLQLVARLRESNPVGSIFVSPDERLIQVTAEYETREDRSAARQDAQDIVSATTFEFTSAMTYKDALPPPREEIVEELQETIDGLIEGKVVEFEPDSDVITPSGITLLNGMLEALRKFPEVSIEIAGHTDDLGAEEYNNDLSRRRAEAVLVYLVSQGELADRFVVVGYGESRPIDTNETDEGRARNRRIEFRALIEG